MNGLAILIAWAVITLALFAAELHASRREPRSDMIENLSIIFGLSAVSILAVLR